MVLSPSGVLEMGIAVAGFNNQDNPSPSDDLNQTIRVFEDGCIFTYDVLSHELTAILPSGGKATLTAPGGVTVNGDTTFNGKVIINGDQETNGNAQVNGSVAMTGNNTVGGGQVVMGSSHSTGQFSTDADVIAGEISLKNHRTDKVQPGNGQSGGPIP